MSQRELPLPQLAVWLLIAHYIYMLERAGVVVRSIKMSLREFTTLRHGNPEAYKKGYCAVLFRKRRRQLRRDIGIILVKGDRWIS